MKRRSETVWKIGLTGLMLLLMTPLPTRAQEEQAEPDGPWTLSLQGLMTATRSNFSNWREGGVNSLGYSAGLKGKAIRQTEAWKQTHTLRMEFGQIKQEELETRKSIDIIEYGLVLQSLGTSAITPTAAIEFRTQFAPGYNYKKNPFDDGREPPVEVFRFMAPAYFTQSLGLSYDPETWLKSRLGIGAKETFVRIAELGELYGLDPGEKAKFELGVESHTEVGFELVENVTLESKLSLFTAFNMSDFPDARWENFLTMRVNSWLQLNAEITALYDADISTRMQYRQLTSIGISVDIF
jgi:hypothetical protein